MIANIDKPKILDVFKKAKAQNLLHLRVESDQKDSLKKSILEIQKFINLEDAELLILLRK